MPTFSKLYRNGSGTFQKGLPKGNYVLDITYSKLINFNWKKLIFS